MASLSLDVRLDFEYGDCDALGARLYGKTANIPAFQVVVAQAFLYKEGYLVLDTDADGIAGRGTLAAIEAYKRGRDDGTKPPAPADDGTAGTAAETIPVLQNVPHYSQAAPMIADIKLGMHENADPCRRSGCLTTAMYCCMDAQRGNDFPAIDSFIEHLASCECYTDRSLLITQKACDEFGFIYCREVSPFAAQNYLRDGIPVILCIQRKGHTHFVIALGYDVMKGYSIHDPGTQFGNFYKEPRYVLSEAVVRYDAVIPKETA